MKKTLQQILEYKDEKGLYKEKKAIVAGKVGMSWQAVHHTRKPSTVGIRKDFYDKLLCFERLKEVVQGKNDAFIASGSIDELCRTLVALDGGTRYEMVITPVKEEDNPTVGL